jgi:hypothetical protein
MGRTVIPSKPFEYISIDLMGPFPISSKGYSYLMVSQCMLSSFIILSPLENKTGDCVSNSYVHNVFSRFGSSKIILSDNGTEFRNSFFLGINKALRQQNVFTLPYHPQSNGRNERSHKSLISSIKSYLQKSPHKHWDVYLPLVEFAYNTVEKAGHGYSPFKLVHSFDPSFPIDTLVHPALNSNDLHLRTFAIRNWRRDKMQECQRIREFVKQILKKEQDERIKIYERKLTKHGYEIGDLVWLYYETRSDAEVVQRDLGVAHNDQIVIPLNENKSIKKLKNKWHGPFRILRKTGLKYEIDIPGNPEYSTSRIIPKVHHDRLKPAYSIFENPPAKTPEEIEIDDLFNHKFLPKDSWEEDLLEDEYEVACIKGHRLRKGEVDGEGNPIMEYRVRWKGYGSKDDTWLELSELNDCPEILNSYFASELFKHYEELISEDL